MVAPQDNEEDAILPLFFAGRSLFITGATGFVGKVTVARLLATCPQLERVHLLMRDKRGLAPHKRLAHLKQSQVFDGIRDRCPEQLDKLSVLVGDVALPRLGLGPEAIAQLQEVSLVIHAAATVKFDEPLAKAAQQNVGSVLAMLELCDQLPRLEAMVHVSTAFTNSEWRVVEERVYPPPADPHCLLELVKTLPEHLLAEVTSRYIAPKPNTYVFTKAVAESAIEQRRGRNYSVAIFRPSIVVAAWRWPLAGWVEGLMGAMGVTVGTGRGLLRVLLADGRARSDLVPVDLVADTLLAACWETASDKLAEVRVYNCSSQENSITWNQMCRTMVAWLRVNPFQDVLWYPFLIFVKNKYLYKILETLTQTMPLYIVEYIAKFCGVKLQMSLITVNQRLQAMNNALKYFTCQDWHFEVGNVQRLRDRLTASDRAMYFLDIRDLNWDEYFERMAIGCRRYLMQQKDDTLQATRRHMNKLRCLHYVTQFALIVLSYKLVSHVAPVTKLNSLYRIVELYSKAYFVVR